MSVSQEVRPDQPHHWRRVVSSAAFDRDYCAIVYGSPPPGEKAVVVCVCVHVWAGELADSQHQQASSRSEEGARVRTENIDEREHDEYRGDPEKKERRQRRQVVDLLEIEVTDRQPQHGIETLADGRVTVQQLTERSVVR